MILQVLLVCYPDLPPAIAPIPRLRIFSTACCIPYLCCQNRHFFNFETTSHTLKEMTLTHHQIPLPYCGLGCIFLQMKAQQYSPQQMSFFGTKCNIFSIRNNEAVCSLTECFRLKSIAQSQTKRNVYKRDHTNTSFCKSVKALNSYILRTKHLN